MRSERNRWIFEADIFNFIMSNYLIIYTYTKKKEKYVLGFHQVNNIFVDGYLEFFILMRIIAAISFR